MQPVQLHIVRWEFVGVDALKAAILTTTHAWAMGWVHKLLIDPATKNPIMLHTATGENDAVVSAHIHEGRVRPILHTCEERAWDVRINITATSLTQFIGKVADLLEDDTGHECLTEMWVSNWIYTCSAELDQEVQEAIHNTLSKTKETDQA